MPERPPVVPQHAGTLDIDVVVDLVVLDDTEAYRTLEDNLKKIGFERAENSEGKKVNWRWKIRLDKGVTIILELLADFQSAQGGHAHAIPQEGQISALNIPHSSIVFDLYDRVEIRAELLHENGIAVETIKHANIVSFTCLKAIAYNDRQERKDAHDLVYCLQYTSMDRKVVARLFREQTMGKHKQVLFDSLVILRKRFSSEDSLEGHRKDGPVAVAKFELGDGDDSRETRVLRQREVAALIETLLAEIQNTE